jgi:hypothetical protein
VKSAVPVPQNTVVTSEVQLRPLSSFAVDKSTGKAFETALAERGSSDVSALFEATIPANRVVGTAQTGFGALHEWEWVVMDTPGEMTWNVTLRSFYRKQW